MTFQELKLLIEAGDLTKTLTFFKANCHSMDYKCCSDQYNPKQHEVVTDKIRRPDKLVKTDSGESKTINVARIPIPLQKRIVDMAAFFLGNPAMQSTPDAGVETDFVTVMNKIWELTKLDYKFGNIAELTMSECECAELWYSSKADTDYYAGVPFSSSVKLSMRILAKKYGDSLYPVFDETGNMIAFGRGYKVKDVDGKDVEHLDIYTSEKFYLTRNSGATTEYSSDGVTYSAEVKSFDNVIKKIPIIYYQQEQPEWTDVQEMIDRLEKKTSNHADTNDYFDSPIVFAEGKIESFSEKGETGKMVQGELGAKVSYITWDQAPESMKMEIDNLRKDIFSLTSTPDISFEQMKSLGIFSGRAIEMLFMDPIGKARKKVNQVFGESVQRRINLLKAFIAVMDTKYKAALVLDIKPKFVDNLPTDITGDIATINSAVSGKILSHESAIKLNPLVTDVDEEKARIEGEEEAATEKQVKLNSSKSFPVNN